MIICLSHYKGGVGKTTLAINLAISLGASILDMDGLESSILFNKLRMRKGHEPLECFTAKNENEMKTIFRQFTGDKILIVDSGGYDSDENRFAMLSANMLLTPLAPSQVEIYGMLKYENILKKISEKHGRIFKTNVIINKADVRSKGAITNLKKFIEKRNENFDLLKTIVHNRADYIKAYAKGLNVIELDPESKAAFEIQQLTKEIRKEIM